MGTRISRVFIDNYSWSKTSWARRAAP